MIKPTEDLAGGGAPLRAQSFRQFFEEAPVGIFFFDPFDSESVMRIVACNRFASRLHGFEIDELIGQSIRKVDPGFFIWDGEDHFQGPDFVAMIRDESVHEGIAAHRRRDGSDLVVEYRTILLEEGGRQYVVGIEQDVTVRERQREELHQTRQQLIDAIESMREGMMIFDAEDRLVAFNTEQTRLLHEVAELFQIGVTFRTLLLAYASRISDERRGGRSVEEYVALTDARRKAYTRNIPVEFLPGQHHRVSHWPMATGGIVTVVTDVTEFQLAVEMAEAAAHAKTQFLGVISHELRTPLNGIVGLVTLLETQDISPEQRRILSLLSLSSKALTHVVADILNLSEREKGTHRALPTAMNPLTLGHDVFNLFRSTADLKGLAYTLEFSGDREVMVEADEAALRQVMSNLIGNAVKFTDSGSVQVYLNLTDGEFTLRVSDTGCGIPAEMVHQIFNSQRLDRPQGVGLAVSKRLIDRMGGEIKCESREGEGSHFEFRVILPLH